MASLDGEEESMDVTIIGTGNMARGIGSRALAGGHELAVVGRRAESAEEVIADLGGGSVASEAGGDVIVLAVYYDDARQAAEQHREQLAGRVVVDITNPVNETFDGLVVPPDSSATKELSSLVPDARWVKAFNTTFANTLVAGEVGGQPLDVLIAGDDDEAKNAVATLATDGGLRPIDTGGLHRARELEALGLLHMTLQDKLGTAFGSAAKFIS
jgi:8-hydroxy-5-deazaflavin:NADPH oxidoreductase